LSSIWQKYGGGYVWIRSLGKNVNALWYILKYVNKTILGEDKAYAALLFASNKRMFSMSQNLLAMLNIKRNRREQCWKFEGTVDESSVKVFCREESVAFEDIIRIEATTEMLYYHRFLMSGTQANQISSALNLVSPKRARKI